MSNLNITERRSGSVTILDLQGDVRLGEGNIKLHNILRSLVEKGERRILLNLAGVAHIDSSGLGELVGGYATLQKNGGELKIVNLTGRIHELMVITKLFTVFDVFENEQEAIDSFQAVSENAAAEESTGKPDDALTAP